MKTAGELTNDHDGTASLVDAIEARDAEHAARLTAVEAERDRLRVERDEARAKLGEAPELLRRVHWEALSVGSALGNDINAWLATYDRDRAAQ